MPRSVRAEAPARLLELPLAADPPAAARLIPRDRHVDEALEEVALRSVRGAPRVLERLVRGEELAGSDESDAPLEISHDPRA